MFLAEKGWTIGQPVVRFLLSSTPRTTTGADVRLDSHVYRRKRQNCQSVQSRPSLNFGKTALFCNATIPNEGRYHVTYHVTFSRKKHLMDCWRFFSRIVKHLLKYNFALENSWPWPLRTLEGLSDVCTTVQSAVSHWEFGLDPSMA